MNADAPFLPFPLPTSGAPVDEEGASELRTLLWEEDSFATSTCDVLGALDAEEDSGTTSTSDVFGSTSLTFLFGVIGTLKTADNFDFFLGMSAVVPALDFDFQSSSFRYYIENND